MKKMFCFSFLLLFTSGNQMNPKAPAQDAAKSSLPTMTDQIAGDKYLIERNCMAADYSKKKVIIAEQEIIKKNLIEKLKIHGKNNATTKQAKTIIFGTSRFVDTVQYRSQKISRDSCGLERLLQEINGQYARE